MVTHKGIALGFQLLNYIMSISEAAKMSLELNIKTKNSHNISDFWDGKD